VIDIYLEDAKVQVETWENAVHMFKQRSTLPSNEKEMEPYSPQRHRPTLMHLVPEKWM